jgi:hypothetical protein
LGITDPIRAFDVDMAIALRCRTEDADELADNPETTADVALLTAFLQGA